jgi:anti-sigma factor RsiW
MSVSDISTSDARLVAYLDGALGDAEARALEADLAADPALAARLAALDVDLTGLRDEMAGLLARAPAMPAAPAAAPSAPLLQMAAAAAIACALVLGGLLAGLRLGAPDEDWRDYAAAYHLLYRPETLAAPFEGDGGIGAVSQVLGRDLSALATLDGLDFRRAQVLGWEDAPLVQLAYLDAEGRPFAVCLMPGGESPPDMGSVDRHGLATTTLAAAGLQILVIGPDGAADTDAIGAEIAMRF